MVINAASFTEMYVPRNEGDGSVLILRSEVDGNTYQFNVTDFSDTADYYHFLVDLEGVPEGEYVYTLGSDSGVMRIGRYNTSDTCYRKEEKHIQYQYGGV